MNPKKIKKVKKYLIILLSIFVVITPFFFMNPDLIYHPKEWILSYFIETFDLFVIFWLFYTISESDFFWQGKIGIALSYIFIGLMLFAMQSTVISLGNLHLLYFENLAAFLSQPIVTGISRTIILVLLIIGTIRLKKLY